MSIIYRMSKSIEKHYRKYLLSISIIFLGQYNIGIFVEFRNRYIKTNNFHN